MNHSILVAFVTACCEFILNVNSQRLTNMWCGSVYDRGAHMLVMGRYLLFKLQLWAYHKSFFESEFDTKFMFP